MRNLTIEHKTIRTVKWILGGIVVLYAIYRLLKVKDSMEQSDWIIPVMLIVLGILLFTPLDNYTKTRIIERDGYLDIKWPGRNLMRVSETQIDRITLSTNYIFIFRKNNNAIKLFLYGNDQKTIVFAFLSEYAREKNIALINQDEQNVKSS